MPNPSPHAQAEEMSHPPNRQAQTQAFQVQDSSIPLFRFHHHPTAGRIHFFERHVCYHNLTFLVHHQNSIICNKAQITESTFNPCNLDSHPPAGTDPSGTINLSLILDYFLISYPI
jgi:hypothetical protein